MERRIVGVIVRRLFWGHRRGGPWAVPQGLAHESLTLEGNSGALLSARFFPRPAPRGVVVLAHPDRRYGQHWFVREGWIPWLLDAGFACLTFDFAPFGQSKGGSTYLLEDVAAACREARRRAPGAPLHIVGLSVGAFAACNAQRLVDDAESLVLESPYPSFNTWYKRGPGAWGMALFDRVFPRTKPLIRADANIALTRARRILVAATRDDEVTRVALSRAVADAAPRERTRYLEVAKLRHLELFQGSREYRQAILETLGLAPPEADRRAAEPPPRTS